MAESQVLRALGREDLMQDPRFSTLPALMANLADYQAALAAAFAELTTDEALAALERNDVPCSKCFTRADVLADPQLAANGTFDIVDHPVVGRLRIVRYPSQFEGEPLPAATPSPAHGADTDRVLAELGVDNDRIAALRAAGIVA